jgi:hypothetical protein
MLRNWAKVQQCPSPRYNASECSLVAKSTTMTGISGTNVLLTSRIKFENKFFTNKMLASIDVLIKIFYNTA